MAPIIFPVQQKCTTAQNELAKNSGFDGSITATFISH